MRKLSDFTQEKQDLIFLEMAKQQGWTENITKYNEDGTSYQVENEETPDEFVRAKWEDELISNAEYILKQRALENIKVL